MSPSDARNEPDSRINQVGRAKGLPDAFTAVPNPFLDRCMADCSGSEVKVFLYIARRTLGTLKARVNEGWDAVALSQICGGIVKRDGTRLDYGTGLGRQAVVEALRRLATAGIIQRRRGDGRHADSYRVSPDLLTAPSSCNTGTAAPLRRYENQTAGSVRIKPQAGTNGEPLQVRKPYRQKKLSSSESTAKRRKEDPASITSRRTESLQAANPAPPCLRKLDDEAPQMHEYPNPREELRAIYFQKTGKGLSRAVLMQFFDTIELRGVNIPDAMEELRRHVPNAWYNPDGFLIDFAKKIGSKMPGSPPTQQSITTNTTEPCAKCRGSGRILEFIKGQRPQLTDRYCDCAMGMEIERTERRIAEKRAVATQEQSVTVSECP
jgi:hypothetical protein